MERTNIRPGDADMLPEKMDLAVMDLSFISLGLCCRWCTTCSLTTGISSVLVKPQFEAGRDKVGKKGVVRSRTSIWRCCGIFWRRRGA
jgi:23S rRNA (cytidine1920-2'-O)/16S rRNA (cytidine1409-2'-O)-methyltransferase